MESKPKKIVMMDSSEAAKLETVTGWVSRLGHFFGYDENTARYDGCTHRKCEKCGVVIEKGALNCWTCFNKSRGEAFERLEKKEWDCETPLVIFDSDTYFFDLDSLLEYCEEHDVNPSGLRLVFCKPVKPPEQNADEMFSEYLPEDQGVEDEDVLDAVDALNAAIAKAKPFSWEQGNVAAIVKDIP